MLCNAAPTVRNLPVVFKTDADYYVSLLHFYSKYYLITFSGTDGHFQFVKWILGKPVHDDGPQDLKRQGGTGEDCQPVGGSSACPWHRSCWFRFVLPNCQSIITKPVNYWEL